MLLFFRHCSTSIVNTASTRSICFGLFGKYGWAALGACWANKTLESCGGSLGSCQSLLISESIMCGCDLTRAIKSPRVVIPFCRELWPRHGCAAALFPTVSTGVERLLDCRTARLLGQPREKAWLPWANARPNTRAGLLLLSYFPFPNEDPRLRTNNRQTKLPYVLLFRDLTAPPTRCSRSGHGQFPPLFWRGR